MDVIKKFFRSAFSVDSVVFGFDQGDLKVLLIYRGAEPYQGTWALPGDLVRIDEDLDESARRVLKDLTGLSDVYMEQIHTFGKVDRHPLGRVITVAYLSLVRISDYKINPSSWAKDAQWHSINNIPKLPFDHSEILNFAKNKLKERVRNQPIGFELLPPQFTLTELQHLYESVLETNLDKRNFRKKLNSMDLLVDSGVSQNAVAHRPAKLYRFDRKRYHSLLKKGFSFEI
ncbi:MAG: NUDIX hydrolase [Bacteroidota bacterium]|jgi:8-oxo-dGTP diphosphatase